MKKELPVRKKIRLEGYDYSSEGAYHITICVSDREHMFGHIVNESMELSDIGMIADRNLSAISKHIKGVKIDKYAVMPNHVHILLAIVENVGTRYIASASNKKNEERTPYMASLQKRSKQIVSKTIQQYKASVSRDSKIVGLWQSKFYDRIIRDEADYQRVWQYIENNPARWADDEYYR